MAQEVWHYVLSGKTPEILDELRALKNAVRILGLKQGSTYYSSDNSWLAFFQETTLPAPCLLRLGHIFAAGLHGGPRQQIQWFAGVPRWLEALLWEAGNAAPDVYGGRIKSYLSHEFMEQVLLADGREPDLLLKIALFTDSHEYRIKDHPLRRLIPQMTGFEKAVRRHEPLLRLALNAELTADRLLAVEILALGQVNPQLWLEPLKRIAAQDPIRVSAFVTDHPSDVGRFCQELMGSDPRPAASSAPAVEESANTKTGEPHAADAGTKAAEAGPAVADPAKTDPAADGIPRGTAKNTAPANDEPAQNLKTTGGTKNRMIDQPRFDKALAAWLAGLGTRGADGGWVEEFQPIPRERLVRAARSILEPGDWRVSPPKLLIPTAGRYLAEDLTPFEAFLALPDLALVHLIRLLYHSDLLSDTPEPHADSLHLGYLTAVFRLFQESRQTSTCPLLDLAGAFIKCGWAPTLPGRAILGDPRETTLDWVPTPIWPYFDRYPQLLRESLLAVPPKTERPNPLQSYLKRQRALEILAMAPHIAEDLSPTVWNLAFSGSRKSMIPAQKALRHETDRLERIQTQLEEGRQEARMAAVYWLGNLDSPRAADLLIAAFKREKKGPIRSAVLEALEKQNRPAVDALGSALLVEEAELALKKGFHVETDWLSLDVFPTLHWRNGKTTIPLPVIQWWIAQAFRLRSAEPTPLLKFFASSINPQGARDLAICLLSAWIKKDTALPEPPSAAKQAEIRAQAAKLSASYPGHTAQGFTKAMLEAYQNTPQGSAMDAVGILALAGAAGAAHLIPLLTDYFEHWCPKRIDQCTALAQMLAHAGDVSSERFLLQIAQQYRGNNIERFLIQAVRNLAQARAWSAEELEDRTISTAGLDHSGRLRLHYGRRIPTPAGDQHDPTRIFNAVINQNLELKLENPEGHIVKQLPKPRRLEDPALTKAAKRRLSRSRRELKNFAAKQSKRLFHAMCLGRGWSFDDWSQFFAQHPLVGPLSQRLIWSAHLPDRKTSFRLHEGRLVNACNQELPTFEPATPIYIAHGTQMGERERLAWIDYGRRYGMEPLFPQLWASAIATTATADDESWIGDFKGIAMTLSDFKRRAEENGYVPESPEAVLPFRFSKPFEPLQMTIFIEIRSSKSPRRVGLIEIRTLYIIEEDPKFSHDNHGIPLARVPPILAAECRHDLSLITGKRP